MTDLEKRERTSSRALKKHSYISLAEKTFFSIWKSIFTLPILDKICLHFLTPENQNK